MFESRLLLLSCVGYDSFGCLNILLNPIDFVIIVVFILPQYQQLGGYLLSFRMKRRALAIYGVQGGDCIVVDLSLALNVAPQIVVECYNSSSLILLFFYNLQLLFNGGIHLAYLLLVLFQSFCVNGSRRMTRIDYVLLDLLGPIDIKLEIIFEISILAAHFDSKVINMHEVQLFVHGVPD